MKQTITVDLETWTPSVLSNITGGIQAGQMMVYSAGRGTGKSMYMKMLKDRIYHDNLCKEIMLPTQPASKYKFTRTNWYTVELLGHSTWRLSDEYNAIIAWCTEQFGPHPMHKDAWSRWWVGLGYICFRDEADYILYQLKWA